MLQEGKEGLRDLGGKGVEAAPVEQEGVDTAFVRSAVDLKDVRHSLNRF